MKKFTRTKEDFVCENCGNKVVGSGFTNHCPECLWSKHVDVNPGDRQEMCKGMMKPVGLEQKNNEFYIIHHCAQCRKTRKNKTTNKDNSKKILELS